MRMFKVGSGWDPTRWTMCHVVLCVPVCERRSVREARSHAGADRSAGKSPLQSLRGILAIDALHGVYDC